MFSLSVTGTPSSGESGARERQRASDARAWRSARSPLTRYIALMRTSQASMRASAACATCTGESSCRAYAAASSPALSSWIAAIGSDYILAAPMLRTIVLLAGLAPAHAATEVRLLHRLDAAMAVQLERYVRDYNAAQHEFHVRLAPLVEAPAGARVRLALPLNTARPVLYYNRDAFRRAKVNLAAVPKTWYEMAPLLDSLAQAGQGCGY